MRLGSFDCKVVPTNLTHSCGEHHSGTDVRILLR